MRKCFDKIGYDPGLFSSKTRAFMLSFYVNSKMSIKRNNSVGKKMDEQAWDMFMEEMFVKFGGSDKKEKDGMEVFAIEHPLIKGISYGVKNLTNLRKRIKIDMSKTTDAIFSPWLGVRDRWIEPYSISYLSSSTLNPSLDPSESTPVFKYTISEVEEGPEIIQTEESESSQENAEESNSDE
jgi:hypothetical protein